MEIRKIWKILKIWKFWKFWKYDVTFDVAKRNWWRQKFLLRMGWTTYLPPWYNQPFKSPVLIGLKGNKNATNPFTADANCQQFNFPRIICWRIGFIKKWIAFFDSFFPTTTHRCFHKFRTNSFILTKRFKERNRQGKVECRTFLSSQFLFI